MIRDLSATAAAGNLAQLAKAAQSVASATANCESVLEPKLDGWRLLAHVTGTGVEFYSRSGKRYDGKLPHVAHVLRELPAGTWIDGEAVAMDFEDDRVACRWATAQKVLGSGGLHPESERITFVAFDLVAYGDQDARSLTYRQRRTLLEQLHLEGHEFQANQPVRLINQVAPTQAGLETLLALGYEGGVVKWLDSRYHAGARGQGWFKLKPEHTHDLRIVGFQDGTNGLTGRLGALEAIDSDGTVWKVGSGITDALRDEIDADRGAWLGRWIEVAQKGSPGQNHRPISLVRVRPDRDQ